MCPLCTALEELLEEWKPSPLTKRQQDLIPIKPVHKQQQAVLFAEFADLNNGQHGSAHIAGMRHDNGLRTRLQTVFHFFQTEFSR